jgi:hypothetical protein
MQIIPYEHTQRHLRQIADMATYKKVHATLPAAEFSAFKSRVKHGDLHRECRLLRLLHGPVLNFLLCFSNRQTLAFSREKLAFDSICLVREESVAARMGIRGCALRTYQCCWELATERRELQVTKL